MTREKMTFAFAFWVVITALALVCGEIFLRIYFYRSLDLNMEMFKYASAMKLQVNDDELVFVHHPSRSGVYMKQEIATNSLGFRDPERAVAKPSGVKRILLLGDSTMLGWGDPANETIPSLLENELNAPGGFQFGGGVKFEALNLGHGNYNTIQEIRLLETRGLRLNPDAVVIQYFINDAEPTPRPDPSLLLKNSYLFNFILSNLDRLKRLRHPEQNWQSYYNSLYDSAQTWTNMQNAFSRLAKIGVQNHLPILFVTLPELHKINENYPFSKIHEGILRIARDNGLHAVDLLPCLKTDQPESLLWVSPEDTHPNGRANHLIAGCIYSELKSLLQVGGQMQ